MLIPLFAAAIVVLAYMLVWYLVALLLRRNDVADIAWGGGFVLAAAVALAVRGDTTPRALLVTTLVSLWGLRLAVHIGLRNLGKGEDARYRAWRRAWGRYAALRSLFQVFLLQGLLIVLVSLPVICLINAPPDPLGVLDLAGALVWLAGFLFEAIGDWQLRQFRAQPANQGRVIQTGLWRYSRHPNYFGEVTLWWGIYLMALAVPGGWWTIAGPVTITFLILGVSGIPLLERRYQGNPEYEEYRQHTSAFFPLPPKR